MIASFTLGKSLVASSRPYLYPWNTDLHPIGVYVNEPYANGQIMATYFIPTTHSNDSYVLVGDDTLRRNINISALRLSS